MYEAYDPRAPHTPIRFRSMDTLTRRFGGTDWQITHGMSSQVTHEIRITRPNHKAGGSDVKAVVRVPYAAVDAAED